MRKFCQNLQNAQLFRPKIGILSAFLPSAAGQNFDTFSVLHTVERGESLQGRENLGDTPSVITCTALDEGQHPLAPYALSVKPCRACQIPPFVTCGDIFPRSGGSLSSKGEPRARPEASSLCLKLQQRALRLGSPFGGAGAGAPERASLSPKDFSFCIEMCF